MGASLIVITARGASMEDAYRNAVEDAVHEHGNDSYNGTISTTSGFVDKTKDQRGSGMDVHTYADWLYDNDKISKWGNAVGICVTEPVGNTNKIKSQVATTPQKGTRKWETCYIVELYDGSVIGSSEFQIDAINLGRKHTEKTQQNTYVRITKKLVNSSNLVSTISYKKSDKERLGSYCFVALAAE